MRLNPDFCLKKYGIYVRLVNEEDANFIVKLRTDPKLGRFIHSTDDDVEKQKQWIRDYKIRESRGLDYYFIYYYNDKPFGLNRICNILNLSATGASGICEKNLSMELPILSILINREIFFEILDIKEDLFDVRLKNLKVQKLHKMFGAKEIDRNELDVFFSLSKEDYLKNKNKIMKYLNIEND